MVFLESPFEKWILNGTFIVVPVREKRRICESNRADCFVEKFLELASICLRERSF